MQRQTLDLSKPKSECRELSGKEKSDEVRRLLGILEVDLKETNLLPPQRNATLEQLRVHGRNPADADPIFSKEGITILTKYAFDSTSPTTSREALRCLQNTFLLKPGARQIFVDLGVSGKAADRLKSQEPDDEFLISRILFLLTYNTTLNFDPLFESNALGENINHHLARHARQYTKGGKRYQSSDIESAALSETLKLLFNISNYYPDRNAIFTPAIESIFKILNKVSIPTPALQAPVNYLINALVNLDLEDRKSKSLRINPIFPKFDQNCNVNKLINVLGQAVRQYTPEQLDKEGGALLSVLRKIYDFAPEQPKKRMETLLLPDTGKRDVPIGQSDTLASRLLKLSSTPVAPNMREGISALMFEMSGKDANQFVKNVGYGFAAGFLMSHNMSIPESAQEAWSDGHGAEGAAPSINPVTGQRLDAEPSGGPPMTKEEREREAERLFVLFERLKATGVMDVTNPVRQAMEEGRLQEIDSGDSD